MSMPLSLSAASDAEAEAEAAAPPPSAAMVAKLLASPKTAVRNRGVRLLSSVVPTLSPAAAPDLLKIWKGLFFCFWHADKALYQSSLATSIASLLSSSSSAPLFLDCSLLTLRREWPNIDFLRMDKFYLLVRRLLHHSLLLLHSHSWNPSLLSRLMDILHLRALSPDGAKGFSYHVLEVFPQELAHFLPLPQPTLHLLLAPFLRILHESTDPILVTKVRAELFAKFLLNGAKYLAFKKSGEEIEKGSEVDKFGPIPFLMGFSNTLLDLAKKEDTVQANKKTLHELRDGFFKLEKDLEKSGIQISLPHTDIPHELMKIDTNEESGQGSGDQLPKKRKKDKDPLQQTKGKKSKDKKSKKKKNKTKDNTQEPHVRESTSIQSEENTDSGEKDDKEKDKSNDNMFNFDENVISNLQKQFEKAAAEAGMSAESRYEIGTGLGDKSGMETTPVNTPRITRKRKQAKSADKLEMSSELELSSLDGKTGTMGKNISSSVKKVRFSMKNNLVWKPSTPMPPQELRLPPSATPRGSALKKGVPPGPVRDISSPASMKRKKSKAKSAKKVLHKGSKSPSVAVKRLRKLQSLSA